MLKYIFSVLMLLVTHVTYAQAPAGPVKIIVPFSAGGNTDIIARVIVEQLSLEIGQPVFIENKVGAGGTIGASAASKAAPNGLTLLLTAISTNASNNILFSELPYDPLKDFEYITTIAATPKVFVTRADFSGNTVKEVVNTVQKNPGKFSYGSLLLGVDYVYAETFKKMTGTNITYVSYKGAGPQILLDILGGHIQFMFDNFPVVYPNVQSGSLKLLAISWPNRLKEYPDVPTWAELGYPQLNSEAWYGLALPKGATKNTVDYYNAAMKRVLANPTVQEKLRTHMAYVIADTPEQAKKRVENTVSLLGKLATDLQLTKTPIGK